MNSTTQATFDVLPHTIFLTVGPSNCGKTHYCRNYLIPQLTKLPPVANRQNVHIAYLSSDDIRREILGQDYDKYHPAMLAASKAAFDLLFQRLKSAMMFPVNTEFIIIDTKGTNDAFREKIYALAENYGYGVVPVLFNYSDYDEYGKYAPMNPITMRDIKKTRAAQAGIKRLPSVKGVIQLKSSDFAKAPIVTCPRHELLGKCFLPEGQEILVISDIHGCYDEFVRLLEESKIKVADHRIVENPAGKHLVIAGDYIDSGSKVANMIDFCFENPEVTVIIGNHENRLYRELTEDLEHIEEPWFDSIHKLDELHKERFISVFRRSVPFARNDFAIITHAPCPAKLLGKVTNPALAGQRYISHGTDNKLSLYEELAGRGVFSEDIGGTLHIFGHILTTTPGKTIEGRMLIDGGCVLGGKLVSVSIAPDGKAYVKSVASGQKKSEGKIPPRKFAPPEREQEVNVTELSYEDKERIEKLVANKVNFLSGTMSPCDKVGDSLETIESGISYFKSKGVTDVVMEPKYMGSRCNLYLFGKNEDSYAISRNGQRIDMDLTVVFERMRERLAKHIDWTDTRLVILDGELMPWSALGEGLIQEFRLVADNVDQENKFLRENGFTEHFLALKEKLRQSGFLTDRNTLSKRAMAEKYGNAQYETFKSVNGFRGYVPIEERERQNVVYKRQMELYGSAGELDYKPFAILKIVRASGEEIVYYGEKDCDMTNFSMFNLLNPDGCHRYNLESEEDVAACVEQFHRYTTEEGHEGVVLKPNRLDVGRVVPYLKVRNPNYLTIIYGYDYLTGEKHKTLCARKSIKGKLKASLREWRKGLNMLAVKYDDIRPDNEGLKKLYASFLFDEEQEKTLDPRL